MKRRIFVCCLSVLLLMGILGGCQEEVSEEVGGIGSEEATTVKKPIAGGELVIGTLQDLEELDPYEVTAGEVREILFNVYEGLVKVDAKGEYVPAVAQEVTVSEDGTTYTFPLREGVTFHDGRAVTAADVIASFDACREKAEDPGLLQALDNVLRVSQEEGAVVVTLRQADPSFLSYASLVYITPEGSFQTDGEDPEEDDDDQSGQTSRTSQSSQSSRTGSRTSREETESSTGLPAGTGPFQLAGEEEDQAGLVLERYDGYWGEKAYLDQVTFQTFSREERLLAALEEGSLDMVLHLDQDQLDSVSASAYKILEGTRNQVQTLYLNSQAEPFDNEQVRQAIRCAVDVDGLISRMGENGGTKVGGPIYPAYVQYYDHSQAETSSYNVERAKELLEEAGYEDGFSMTITVPSGQDLHAEAAEILSEQLAEVGIRATVRTVSWENWLSRVYTQRDFDSTVVSFDTAALSPEALLFPWKSDSESNFSGYSDAQYDRLLEEAAAATEEEEQTDLYQQAAQRLAEQGAGIFLQDLADFVVVRTYVDGYQFYPLRALNLAGLYFVQDTGSAGSGE